MFHSKTLTTKTHLEVSCLLLGGLHLPHRLGHLLVHLADLRHRLLFVAQLRLLDLSDLVLNDRHGRKVE